MRILVILFNLVFVLVGCAILAIAIFLYVDTTFKGLKDNMESKVVVDIILFSAIGVGGVTIIVGTFGCCGAYHESECLLGTYFLCLFVIVAAEVAAGVLLFVKADKNTISDIINKSLISSIDAYMAEGSTDGPPPHLKQIQIRLQCCGANSFTDYVGSFVTLPSTDKALKAGKACIGDDFSVPADLPKLLVLKDGCTNKIMNLLTENKLWVFIVIIVVAAFELLTMIVAMSLCCTVRRMESGYIGVST